MRPYLFGAVEALDRPIDLRRVTGPLPAFPFAL